MTLDDKEFIRRFLLHVQPPGFPRIRYFGFLANRYRKEKLALCRKLIAESTLSLVPEAEQCRQLRNTLSPVQPQPAHLCPRCGSGVMIRLRIVPAFRWPERPPDTS